MIEIKEALKEYDKGNKEAAYKIILKMMPLIKSFSIKIRSFMEVEDSVQEFSIVIITIIPELERGRGEGEYTKYLEKALKYRCQTLCEHRRTKYVNMETIIKVQSVAKEYDLDEIELENDIYLVHR